MRGRISRHSGHVALAISILALVGSATGLAEAARRAVISTIDGHQISTTPHAGGLLLLGKNRKFAASAIPTVKDASEIGGKTLTDIEPSCPPATVNLGTWCLMDSPYPLTNAEVGENNYFWASQACVKEGGYLPTAAQLIGAANRVRLELNDPRLAADRHDPARPERRSERPARDERNARDDRRRLGRRGIRGCERRFDRRSAHGRTEPGAAAGCAGALDAAVRDRIFQRHEGRLCRLPAGLRTAELPLCVQRDARGQLQRRSVGEPVAARLRRPLRGEAAQPLALLRRVGGSPRSAEPRRSSSSAGCSRGPIGSARALSSRASSVAKPTAT